LEGFGRAGRRGDGRAGRGGDGSGWRQHASGGGKELEGAARFRWHGVRFLEITSKHAWPAGPKRRALILSVGRPRRDSKTEAECPIKMSVLAGPDGSANCFGWTQTFA